MEEIRTGTEKKKKGISLSEAVDIECVDKSCSLKIREWLTAEEAADYLRVSLGTLRNLTSSNLIPSYRLGSRVRFRLDDLRDHLLSNKKGERKWDLNTTRRFKDGKRLYRNVTRFRENQSR